MKYTPYAAFGTVVILCTASPGDNKQTVLGPNGLVTSGWYYYTSGRAEVTVIATGERLADRTPGWLNVDHSHANASNGGTASLSFPVPTQWVCIPHAHNAKGLPTLSSLVFSEGETKLIPNETNLFLARGTLVVNGKSFTGPAQIRIRSGEATAVASTECYSLIFK